jgi:amidase
MNWHDMTIGELQREQTLGRVSASLLTRHYLTRIEALDRAGPTLRAVIETNPDALAIAAELDRERSERGPRGALHGIPILVKDNLDSGDRMATSAGSIALEDHRAERDAFVVARLRAAGAVLLGKTNLSEWANFRSKRSSSGWSSRGGQTRNPYALDRSPCGSSSGSGVAVAAGLAAAAIGTETDGSIVCPASVCGVVGLKPTVGMVSRAGIIPISASQDTAGPMTRSVADAALLMGVIAGVDAADAATERAEWREPQWGEDLRGVRLGIAAEALGHHEAADAVFAGAVTTLRALGATVIEGVAVGDRVVVAEAERIVLASEFRAGLNAYLAMHPGAVVRSLEDLIAFNVRHAARVMPYFRQERLEEAAAAGALTDVRYLEAAATARRLAGRDGIDAALARHRLDALIAPTRSPAWVIDVLLGDRALPGCSTFPAVAGYPHVSVPAGFAFGLPVGLSFFGGAWSDAALLRFAAAFEGAVGRLRAPGFEATVV